jgi:aldose 1-epimerase
MDERGIGRFGRLLCAGVALLILCGSAGAGPIEVKDFGGTLEAFPVKQYVLTNSKGASVRIIDFGAIVTNLFMPDKAGKMQDLVLGFDDVRRYQEIGPYMGCIVGRYANRIANGIFTLDGRTYAIPANLGVNSMHGGFKGYSKRMWNADAGMTPEGPAVRLSIDDPDGSEGFPGNVHLTVIYTLTNDNTLKVQYFATADRPTPINLTHHSYFNLAGNGSGDVLGYVAHFTADHYLAVDSSLIPTGEVKAVAGTPFDFTKPKRIGRDIAELAAPLTGYDHTMVLDNPKGQLMKAAEIYDPQSGRMLECLTTEPAFHFFTGNNLAGIVGKGGVEYKAHGAFCLECQHYPDSPNHANFPSTILRPGQIYRQITEYHFSTPATPLAPAQ